MVNSQNLTSDTQNTLCFWPASKYTANTQSNTQWWWSLADQGVTCASCQVLIQNYPEVQYLSSRFGCLVTCDRLPRSNLPPKHVLVVVKLTKNAKNFFACGALIGAAGPDVVCILASGKQIHKIHCVFSPTPNTQNTDLASKEPTAY